METDQNFNTNKPKKSWFLKWVVALAIVIVLNLFFNYAIQLFYDKPDFVDFCGEPKVAKQITTQSTCESEGGRWNPDISGPSERLSERPVSPNGGWCDVNYECRMEYENVRDVYNRNVFVILVVLGIIALSASFKIKQSEAVSLGFSLGGVLSLIIASMRYWSNMNDVLRFIVLGIALAILVWLGIKKIKD